MARIIAQDAEDTGQPGMSGIRFLKGTSLSELVRKEIEAMIIAGHFAPNERINELSLATQCGVSRAPVREACRALAAIGLLEYIPNRGLFVRQMDEAELREVDIARGFAFGAVAWSLAENASAMQVHELRGHILRMEEVVRSGSVGAYYPLNVSFHQALCDMCGNRRLAATYQGFARELHVQRFRGLSAPASLELSNREHGEIVEAIAESNPQAAFDAARGHVMNGYARILEQRRLLEGAPTGKAGTPRTG
ncbi:GntR family transcriptional regulator [Albidovulum sediminis]|uniref:GntR family transcriptional regulator n=1 Tax=Albidovulum sediminis TaxID=3066345 RepID=A0ABT2NRN2_9RHOB|nr:GntR family transcriptional regulator [Defluviimonas sediminis]MCT8331583.1 GntR family transcriptional regulator [Defluviimonas sediminis]